MLRVPRWGKSRQPMRGLIDAEQDRVVMALGQKQRAVAVTATQIHDQWTGAIAFTPPARELGCGRRVQGRAPRVFAMALHDLVETTMRPVLRADDLRGVAGHRLILTALATARAAAKLQTRSPDRPA